MRQPRPAARILLVDNSDRVLLFRFTPPDGMGLIPLDRVEGRALITFFSTDGSVEWLKPWTWVSAARPDRIGEGF